MGTVIRCAMASVGLSALCAPMVAFAESARPRRSQTTDEMNDVVVFARREAENIRNVFVSIQVVTAKLIGPLRLRFTIMSPAM